MTRRKSLLIFAPLSALAALVLAGVGLSRYDSHLLLVTGRADIPRVLCTHCHWKDAPPQIGQARDGQRYVNPVALAVSADGTRLYVAASTQNLLLEVDLATKVVARSVEVGSYPRSLALSSQASRLAVSCRGDDEVVILDTDTLSVTERLKVGAEPVGLAFGPDAQRLFVANSGNDNLEAVNLADQTARQSFGAGQEPLALAMSADGALLCAVNRHVRPARQDQVSGAEITLLDVGRMRVGQRRELHSAHLGQDIALSSDGAFALVPVVHFRNQLPITQVARGAVMTGALAFVETREGGKTVQFPLDEVNAYFADPAGIALTPDDRIAFVSHAGADLVSAIDVEVLQRLCTKADAAAIEAFPDDLALSAQYVLARIPTRQVPEAMAMSADGALLYVAERLADSIAIIDVATLAVVDRIDLGGARVLTAERRGERVFHDASATFQGQFSCSSCHPEGHTDSIIWDFEIDGVGQNLLETRSLRGIRDTPPFKWNGKNPDLHTQCGPRFARVLMRSEPFPPAQLDDLVAYIESIPLRSRRAPAQYAEARERGREIFLRTHDAQGKEIPVASRCNTCHRPPLYTDLAMTDVGTDGVFDTPHLFDVGASAPYLHDGRSLTLEEIWTVHSPDDTHGRTNDLSKIELNDLVLFLQSL